MKFCGNCGKELVEGAPFCPGCGARVNNPGEVPVQPMPNQGERNCLIKVTRLSKTMGFAITFELFIDGYDMGTLTNGKTIDTYVTPGTHTVVIKSLEKDYTNTITLGNGQPMNVEISLQVAMGLIAGTPKIKDIRYY